MALQDLRRHDEALAAFDEAIKLAPEAAEPYNNRAVALRKLGRIEEALASVQKAIDLQPSYPEAYNTLGNIFSAMERLNEALEAYEQATRQRPGFVEAEANVLLALSDLDRSEEALERLEALTKEHGSLPLIEKVRGILLVRLERYQEAEEPLRRALAVLRDDAEVMAFLGASLHMQGYEGEAEELLSSAIPRLSRPVSALNALGNLYGALGRKDEAVKTLLRAIEIEPNLPGLYRNLAGLYSFRRGDGYFERLEELYRHIEDLKPSDQVDLLYALAEAYDDVGEQERAFDLFIEAGRRYRAMLSYDLAVTERMLERLMLVFTRERYLALQGRGYPSRLPVFIVGMPRSGTTLMEQIIAAHPKAFGAGELRLFVESLGYGLMVDDVHLDGMPPELSDPGRAVPIEEGLFAVGKRYVTKLRLYNLTAWRITDKMPGNYAKLPLLALAIPGAKIIHMRRHPLDTCISCFKTRFTQGHEWTYDLRELGRYYSGYWRLVAHWRKVCPEAFIEVEYERLVSSPEEEIRRVLDYVELPWDERCLRFYELDRPVHTASMAQVREPIYTKSVGKWRKFLPRLTPLIEELDQEIIDFYKIPKEAGGGN